MDRVGLNPEPLTLTSPPSSSTSNSTGEVIMFPTPEELAATLDAQLVDTPRSCE
jgi:hypothetical protein